MHRNRKPCNSFLMVKMASGMDHGCVRPTTTTTTTNDVAQHGGHLANTKSCSLGLQHISLILDIHTMFKVSVYPKFDHFSKKMFFAFSDRSYCNLSFKKNSMKKD